MGHCILHNGIMFGSSQYKDEEEITKIFQSSYNKIVSEKSFFLNKDMQFSTNNFKNSRCDGFLLVWENPTTPCLYITEVELERHSVSKHILPQIGDFISFIQTNQHEQVNKIRDKIYDALRENESIFRKIQDETGMEVYAILQAAFENLQILLVIDKISTDLIIGLNHIEKAINVKIRKIEVQQYISKEDSVKIISFYDNEYIFENESDIDEEKVVFSDLNQYSLGYHIKNKDSEIVNLFNKMVSMLESKLRISPRKYYIGFSNDSGIVVSIVVMTKKILLYAKIREGDIPEEYRKLKIRNVEEIGHYSNHLPSEITIEPDDDFDLIERYIEHVIEKFGGCVDEVDNSAIFDDGISE